MLRDKEIGREEIINEITKKKEFSHLPEKDVDFVFAKFEKRQVSDEEKIRLTRELLHKIFSSFTSSKLLSPKDKTAEWILRKHLSTRERLPYYKEVYRRVLKDFEKNISIIDMGAGVNGFSSGYFKELGKKIDYVAVEAVGQLVNLTNDYFTREKIHGKAIHMSLFELDKLKKIISATKKPRIVFLFKTIDSLEMLKRDYSFKLIQEIIPIVDRFVVSFAVASMISRKKFKVNRRWIVDFINNNFNVLDDFEIGGERYICFAKFSK